MSTEKEDENKLLPHHEQLPLCTTRQPYRQGRKLTAVKVYTINNESRHLLVFGVPSLNLRHEVRDLFIKFGRLVKFSVTLDYPAEDFTETYHACYERIQSARIAKKMLDTKNFYGGILHISYAPELENIDDARSKLLQRKKDVMFRMRNAQKETTDTSNLSNIECNSKVSNIIECNSKGSNIIECNSKGSNIIECNSKVSNEIECNYNLDLEHPISEFQNNPIVNEIPDYELKLNEPKKLNMGENNVIYVHNRKRKSSKKDKMNKKLKSLQEEINEKSSFKNDTAIVDCTSTDRSVISNINEALNYNKFGNEVIRKIDLKPVNKIVFHNKEA